MLFGEIFAPQPVPDVVKSGLLSADLIGGNQMRLGEVVGPAHFDEVPWDASNFPHRGKPLPSGGRRFDSDGAFELAERAGAVHHPDVIKTRIGEEFLDRGRVIKTEAVPGVGNLLERLGWIEADHQAPAGMQYPMHL